MKLPPLWLLPALILLGGIAVSSVLAATLLDTLVHRPIENGGSITTLFPGLVYAMATVMKLCVAAGILSALGGTIWRFTGDCSPRHRWPVWALVSLAVTTALPLAGTLGVLVLQRLVPGQGMVATGHYAQVSRLAVFLMLVGIIATLPGTLWSLYRREQPLAVAMLALAMNVALAGAFWHFRFYALGFHQDTWANSAGL